MTAPATEQDFDTEIREARKGLTKAIYDRLAKAIASESGGDVKDLAEAAAILKATGFLKLPSRPKRPERDGVEPADVGYVL